MTVKATSHTSVSPLQYAVYQCLCYYDIFNYPLKLEEIEASLPVTFHPVELLGAIHSLIDQQLLFTASNYYFIREHGIGMIAVREENEARYAKHKSRILRSGKWIARFPFVRGVAISGSCAKGVFPEDGDVDFFIITAKDRVWICRTCLILYKKIFLLNSKRFFCVNYFIDENNLIIPDQNVFVAHEIKFLRPIVNGQLHTRFLSQNQWTNRYLPNMQYFNNSLLSPYPHLRPVNKVIEWLLSGKLGAWVDHQLFKLTLQVWKRKFPDFNMEDFDLNLRSKKHVSKHHPRGFQKRVLNELERKLQKLKAEVV
jgi:hypothetical protein